MSIRDRSKITSRFKRKGDQKFCDSPNKIIIFYGKFEPRLRGGGQKSRVLAWCNLRTNPLPSRLDGKLSLILHDFGRKIPKSTFNFFVLTVHAWRCSAIKLFKKLTFTELEINELGLNNTAYHLLLIFGVSETNKQKYLIT